MNELTSVKRGVVGSSLLLIAVAVCGDPQPGSPDERAVSVEAQMYPSERVTLTHGSVTLPGPKRPPLPNDALIGAGYIAGIPRLHIPSLRETDASLGVAWVGGLRHDDGATPLPSGIAMGATWNPTLVKDGGSMIGAEAKSKGFNVMLAGGVNLVRDPRNGRSFEYFGEDPLLSGRLAGAAVAGIQSNHIISTVKHFAFNDQETGRDIADVRIKEGAARESDLLAFEIAIEQGDPGAVMCGYNLFNGMHVCDSDWLLNQVLKREWNYKGFVMSDWGAVPDVDAALHGLDQESGAQLDPVIYFEGPLRQSADRTSGFAKRLADMNRRILYAIYANELDKESKQNPIDHLANQAVAGRVASEGMVLLRNQANLLPLATSVKNIAVIGGFSANGVLTGGGSTQVHMNGGPAVTLPVGEDSPMSIYIQKTFQRSVPLKAIRERTAGATVTYRTGDYPSEAAAAAKAADVAIVFATQWATEGFDLPDLSLPAGQDELIEAVASVNPRTIVVLESGSAVLMPWLDRVGAVIEAWYPGAEGANILASVLFGDINPSGRLPITFPATPEQLPRKAVDGSEWLEPALHVKPITGHPLLIDYNIEGSDVGYRWYARQGLRPLFPFGFGLSFTTFRYSQLELSEDKATVTVTNTGERDGQDVVQLYLTALPTKKARRLVGFDKISLKPGESRSVQIPFEKRVLAHWANGHWVIDPGEYRFAVGQSAEDLGPDGAVRLTGAKWN